MKTNRMLRSVTASLGVALVAIMASSALTRPVGPRVLVPPVAPPTPPLFHYAMDDVDFVETNLGSTGAADDGDYLPNPGPGMVRDLVDKAFPAPDASANIASRFVATNTNHRLAVPDVSAFPFDVISAACWVKTSGTNAGTLISYAEDALGHNNEFLFYDTRNLRIYIEGSSRSTGVSVNDGQWHHVVATWQSVDGRVQLYKDGVLAYESTGHRTGRTLEPLGTLVIAQEQDVEGGNFNNWEALRGNIDDVRIYDYMLTPDNVQYLANIVDPPGISLPVGTFQLPNDEMVDLTFGAGTVPGDQIYYTINGADPDQLDPAGNGATLYSGTIDLSLAGPSVELRARAYDSSGVRGPSTVMRWLFSIQYDPVQATPGSSSPAKIQGIYTKYYTGTGAWLPDFPSLIAEQRTREDNFTIAGRTQNDNFGFEFEGFLEIPAGQGGVYQFSTRSDDGSKFFLTSSNPAGELEVVDNDGPHGMRRRFGHVFLVPGLYGIRVPFSQGGGGFGLEVEWNGPASGNVREQIPDQYLWTTPLVETPIASQAGGTYATSPLNVTISSATGGAIIYYTQNGDAPDARAFKGGGFTPVVAPISTDSMLRAIAYDPADLLLPSTISLDTYVFSPPGPPQLLSAVADGTPLTEVILTFDRPLETTSAELEANYSIDNGGGTPSTAVLQGTQTVVLNTAAPLTGPPTLYTVTVTGVRDSDTNSPIPSPGATASFQVSASGTIFREWWTMISGGGVNNLTSNPAYPGSPTGSDQPLNFQNEDPGNLGNVIVNWMDNYGTRFRGYFIPDQTGLWYFRISSDDNSELYLSTDTNPANKSLISQVTAWTGSRQWNDSDVVPSAGIQLTAGQRYYIESLQKEGGGGDSLSVRAQFNNSAFTNGDPPIPGSMLAPFLAGGAVSNPGPPAIVTATALDINTVQVVFDREVEQASGETLINYSVAPLIGNPDAAVRQADNKTVVLTFTTNPLSTSTVYTITINGVQDITGNNPNSSETYDFALASSGITRKWWFGIGGGSVSNLTSNAAFPDNPSGSDIGRAFSGHAVDGAPLAPFMGADNYGTQFQGYFIPDTTGDYVFAISSDDRSQLWLSTDSDPANKVLIAQVPGWTGTREFNKYLPDQQSDTFTGGNIALVADQRYYIESLQKEGGGGDRISVAVARVGGPTTIPIPNGTQEIIAQAGGVGHIFLTPFSGVELLQITKHPEDRYAPAGTDVTFEVIATGTGPLTYDWYKDGVLFSSGGPSTLTLYSVDAADQGVYHVVVSQPAYGYSQTSQTATLSINDTVAPQLLAVAPVSSAGGNWSVLLVFDEVIDQTTAEDLGNYSIVDPSLSPGTVTITGATLQQDGMTVVLDTDPLCNGITYEITVNPGGAIPTAIQDLSVPPNFLGTVVQSFTPTGKPSLQMSLHWPFDEGMGTTTADLSPVGTGQGTLFDDFGGAPPSWSSKPFAMNKNAIQFQGDQASFVGHIVHGARTDDPAASGYSSSFWFRTADADGGIFALTLGNPPLAYDRVVWLESGNLWARTFNIPDEFINTTGTNYADNAWHHVVHVMGGAQGGQQLYVDGVQVNVQVDFGVALEPSGNATESQFGTSGARVGDIAGSAAFDYFDGWIDDVRVFDRALSDQEITELANPNWPPEVDLGPDYSIPILVPVQLTPSVVEDDLPNGPGTHTFHWTVIQQPGGSTVTFSDTGTNESFIESPTITVDTANAGVPYVLHLEVDDGELSSCDRVAVIGTTSTNPEVIFTSTTSQEVEPPSPTQIAIEVGLTIAATSPVTVDYSFAPGSATSPADFDGTAGQIVFQPGEVRKDILVTIQPDSDVEGNHDFTVNLDSATGGGATIGSPSAHTHTILDDDSPPIVEFALASSQVQESISGSLAQIEVSLSWPYTNGAVTVPFTVAAGVPPATGGGVDYNIVTSSVTIPAGQTSANIDVTLNDDFLDEDNERFTVTFQAGATPAGVTLGPVSAHTMTILDDDLAPIVFFPSADNGAGVSETTVAPINIPVNLSATSGQTVTVNYDITSGTATGNGVDYTLANGTLTFVPPSTTQNIVLQLHDDVLPEGTETIEITLTSPVNASVGTGFGQFPVYTFNITDDDSLPELTFDATDSGGAESVTAVDLSVSLTMAASDVITVDYAVVALGTTATDPDDYALLGTGLLTFNPGEIQQFVQLSVVNDFIVEPDETVVIQLSNPFSTLGTINILNDTHTYTIVNDDTIPTLTIDDVAIPEGDVVGPTQATFTLTLQPAPGVGENVIVDIATSPGTATPGTDYNATPSVTQVTFATGETTKTVDIDVFGDTIDELNETFNVNLTMGAGTDPFSIGDGTGVGTITDDDAAPTITLTQITADPVPEGSPGPGNTTVTYQVDLTGNQTSLAVTANITVAGSGANPATAGADFNSTPSPTSINIAPGGTTQQFTVDVVQDAIGELDETYDVTLTAIQNATPGTVNLTTTIQNDDQGTFTISNVQVSEGDGGGLTQLIYTVDLFPPPSAGNNATIQVDTLDTGSATGGGVDYNDVVGTVLDFQPGVTQQTVTLEIVADNINEDNQTFDVVLSNPGGSEPANLNSGSTATVTILDDDLPPDVSVSVAPGTSIAEGDPPTPNTFTITVMLSAASEKTITVDYRTVDISAFEGSDYNGFPTFQTLTFLPGGALSQQVLVTTIPDTIGEPNETFTFDLGQPVNVNVAAGSASTTLTITNDDLSVLSIDDQSVTEGDTGQFPTLTFTVTLTPVDTINTVTVNWATQAASATEDTDYQGANGTLTFTPGTATQTVVVTVIGDDVVEGDETFTVELSGASNATIGDGSGLGTITDDDLPGASIDDVTLAEGTGSNTTFSFTVTLDQANPSNDVTIDWSTADDTATAPADYLGATGQVTVPAGATTASTTIDITVIGDTTGELDETFFVNLTGATNGTISDGQGVGTITNDDLPSLSIGDVTVVEGDAGTTNAVFTVAVSGVNLAAITVDFVASDITANVGADYQATGGTLNIPANQPSGQIIVPVIGDTTDEVDETFLVTLSGETNATLTNNTATGTITDDDGPDITIDDVTMVEGTGGTVNFDFTVTLSAPSPQDVTLDFATADGTATAGSDYTAIVTTPMTILANDTTGTITVVVDSDSVDEPDETFFVDLTNATNGTITVAQGIGTIQNDDDLIIVTGGALPSGTEGAFYQTQVLAGGGLPPYVWSLEPGSDTPPFPFGLDPSTGTISGVAPFVGVQTVYTFDLRVTDSQNPTESVVQTFTITVDVATGGSPTVAPNPAAPDGTVGVAYSHTFTATDGTPPYTWGLFSGTLPSGLTLNANTGELSGTPDTVQAGVTFTVEVTDQNANTGTLLVTIDINLNPVTISPTSLPDGDTGSFYSQPVSATGGIGPYTWSLSPGGTAVPAGLSISGTGLTATISGTPSAAGNYDFNIDISDDGQGGAATDTLNVTLTINSPGGPLTISPIVLPQGTETMPYPGATFSATGGTPPYTWTITGLPASMTYNANTGDISGTPDTAGSFPLNVQVVDTSVPNENDSTSVTLIVASLPSITTPGTLPNGTLNVAYFVQLNAVDGVPPYTWALAGGSSLPGNLTIDPTSGAISGTDPGAAATSMFTVDVTDSNGGVGSQLFDLTVIDPAAGLQLLTSTLPRGTVGVPYSTTLQGAGGTPPYTWTVFTGILPAGLSLDAVTGTIFGTPTAAVTENLEFQLDDTVGPPVVSALMPLTIDPVLTVATASLPNGGVNVAYSTTLSAGGAVGPTTWSILTGSLPVGLGLNPATGEISGIPTVVGPVIFQVQVQDGQGRTAQRQLTLTIVLSLPGNGSSNDRECSVFAAVSGTDGSQSRTGVLWTALLLGAAALLLSRRRKGRESWSN